MRSIRPDTCTEAAARRRPVEPRQRAEVLSALHANVVDVFNEHGVQIMSPHYLRSRAREGRPPSEVVRRASEAAALIARRRIAET